MSTRSPPTRSSGCARSAASACSARLGVNATARASFGPYNVPADIDALIDAIVEAQEVFAG